MKYTVTWTIEVNAECPEEAAVLAHEMATDPETTATVYQVVLSKETYMNKWVDVDVSTKKRSQ